MRPRLWTPEDRLRAAAFTIAAIFYLISLMS